MIWHVIGAAAAAVGFAALVERFRAKAVPPLAARVEPAAPGLGSGPAPTPGLGGARPLPSSFLVGESLLVDPAREPGIASPAELVVSNGGPIRVRVIATGASTSDGGQAPIVAIADRRMSGNVFIDPGPLPLFAISGAGVVARTSSLESDAVLPGDLVAVDPARAFGNAPEIMAAILPLLEGGGPLVVRAVNDRPFSLSAPTFRAVLADKRLPPVQGSESVMPGGFPVLLPTQAVAEVPYAAIIENRGQAPAGVTVGATRRRRSRVGIDGRFR